MVIDVYIEAFTNVSFLILFALSQMVLYIGNDWALKQLVWLTQNRRSYFAETFLSFIHAIITSITCCLQLYFNTEFTRRIYSYSASLSCAYFVVHGFNYLNFKGTTNIVFVIHHLLAFVLVLPITNLNSYYLQESSCSNVVYFVSAGLHLVEISTLWLDVRIFSKLWQKRRFYFVSTVGLVATYFPLRCVWLGYVTYVIVQSREAFDACFGSASLYLLLTTFGFIMLMSFVYSITMLKSGTKLFQLQHYKDC